MKIILANAPFIRFNESNPKNDQRFNLLIPKLRLKISNYHYASVLLYHLGIARNLRFGVRAGSRWPWTSKYPIGALHFPFIMAYSSSYLRQAGHDVEIFDAIANDIYSYEYFINYLKLRQPDIVILECSTPSIDIDLWMADEISKFTEVALAGPHLTLFAEEIQTQFPNIRYLLKGEYIKSSLLMVSTRRPGIYESEIVKDLDDIPFPFRDFTAATKYFDPSMPTPKPQLQIYGSKGCPFKCTYCMWPQTMYKGTVALRDPQNIAKEIRHCENIYGYNSIFFDDDTFNIGNNRISKLCDELGKIGLPWTMMGRIDASPSWLFDKMIDCGCVGMRFGVETFDINILKQIEKGIEHIDFKQTLEHLALKYPDLMIHITMMKNLPGQSEKIHQNDINILKDMGFLNDQKGRSFQVASCVPFPGTKMYNELVLKYGNKINQFMKFDGGLDTIMKEVNEWH